MEYGGAVGFAPGRFAGLRKMMKRYLRLVSSNE